MDQETKDRVLGIINSLGFKNLFITQAKRADTFFKPRIIVAINDRNLITFNNRGTKSTNQFSWLTIKYIGRELNKLRFQFDKTRFAFEFTEEALFRDAVSPALQNILTHAELKAIKFDQFRIPFIQTYSPSSVINRIIERSNLLKNPIYENTLETIRSFLVYSLPDIKIGEIPGIDKFLSIILDSLPFWTNTQTISISEMGIIDPYQVTLPYASYFSLFKVLEMNCKKSSDFESFMNELKKKDETQPRNLFGLSFIRSEFDKEDLPILQNFIISEKIQSLEFHDAISRNTMYDFCTHFLSTSMMRCLTILNLDHTKNIANNISMITPALSNLIGLSLADCDIEVCEALFTLSRLPKLRILNLSNSTCRKPINGLPKSLTTLYLNSVNWCFQTLQLFLMKLPPHHLTLYLNNINMQQQADYDDLFVKLPTAKSNFLKGLSWDGNRIEQGLFDFLSKNRSLDFLSLSYCFSNTDGKQVSMLRQYLTQFRTVKKLIVQGNGNKFLGNLVEQLIDGVLKSPQIEFLDITRNRGGDHGMNQMRRLLTSHPNLKNFIFDRTEPTKYENLNSFLKDAEQNRNLKLSYPIEDVKSMLKKGQINEDNLKEIRSYFIDKSRPENIYITFYNNDFPRFLSASEIEELKKEVVDFDPINEQNQNQNQTQNQQLQKKAESPKSNKTTSYNINYGTLKSKVRTDFFGPLYNQQQQQQQQTRKSPVSERYKNQAEDQNQYLLKQNRKIQKMIPKETDKSFDSESASYNNQESSSNDFFIPNNYNNDNEAATVRNRPIRHNLSTSRNNKSKGTRKRHPKAASLAPAKKRKNRSRELIRNQNDNDFDDDEFDDDNDDEIIANNNNKNRRQTTTNSARKPRRPRSNASQHPKTTRRPTQSNKNLFDDEYEREIHIGKTPKSARGNRTSKVSASGSRRKSRRPIRNNNNNNLVDDDDYDLENDDRNEINVRPMLRTRKNNRTKRLRETFNDDDDNDIINNDNGDDDNLDDQEEEELSITYQQPTWDFPIKMKYIYETDISKKIEDKYSNNSFASAILDGTNEKAKPKQRRTVTRKKKV